MNADNLDETEKKTMLQRLLQYRMGTSNDLISDQNIISEHMGHLFVPTFNRRDDKC